MRMASSSLVLVLLVGVGLAAAAVPSFVDADAQETYDALQMAEADAAMDERDALASAGLREVTAQEASKLSHELDAIEDADEEALAADEVEVDADMAADAAAEAEEDASEDLELVELDTVFASRQRQHQRFGPFQAAANVMPYNVAVDPGHNFMNPFIRGYNPAYDGYTPQPGGMMWNNPNGPNWSPFHWSAPASYWSVYPPQYASHYVEPGMYHAPGMHQFFGPNSYGGHNHRHSPDAAFPYGGTGMHSMDPHVFGPHLDWPFGALTSDMDHVPGMGTGVNPLQRFPQFLETNADADAEADAEAETEAEAEDDAEADAEDEDSVETEVTHQQLAGADADAESTTTAVDSDAFEVDASNHVISLRSACVNCAYRQ